MLMISLSPNLCVARFALEGTYICPLVFWRWHLPPREDDGWPESGSMVERGRRVWREEVIVEENNVSAKGGGGEDYLKIV